MSASTERAARAPRQLAPCLCLAAGLVLLAVPASAQEQGSSPLRLLKPWIERQLFGSPTSPDGAPAVVKPDPAGPDDRGTFASRGAPAPDPAGDPAAEAVGSVPTTGGEGGEAAGRPGSGAADPITAILNDTAEPKPEVLRLGVLGGRSPAATMAAVRPLAETLKASLGRPVEFLPLASYGAMIDAQVQRRIDGGFFSTAAFAEAERLCACLEPLVAPRASDGTSSYRAIVVARADSGILRPADLGGRTVAIGPPDSIAARRVQLAGLTADGVDPAGTFGAIVETASVDEAVRLVLRGRVDAAFVWSSLSGSADTGYSRGALADLLRSGELAVRSLVIVWRSPPIGHGPLGVRRSLSAEDKLRLEQSMLGLAQADPAAYDVLDPLYGGGFAAVDAPDYSGVEALLDDAVELPGIPLRSSTLGAAPADVAPPDGTAN